MPENRLLIHIGYQKASSTFLQDRLFRVPDHGFWAVFPEKTDRIRLNNLLYYPSVFTYDPEPLRQEVAASRRIMPSPDLVQVISAESLVGNPWDRAGLTTRAVADRIADTFPDCRVLVVVREQASIILSRYYQYVRGGGIRSLESFVHRPDDAAQFDSGIGVQLSFFEYDHLVAYYQSKLGRENVLALPFEFLRRDPKDYVRRIADFSGARTDPEAMDLSPVKEAIPASVVGLRRAMNGLISRNVDNPFAYLLPEAVYWRAARLPKTWLDRLGRNFDQTAAKRKFSARLDAIIGDHYRDSNRRLASLTGFDFGELGYKV